MISEAGCGRTHLSSQVLRRQRKKDPSWRPAQATVAVKPCLKTNENKNKMNGGVVQMGRHLPSRHEALGSIPASHTHTNIREKKTNVVYLPGGKVKVKEYGWWLL